MPAQVSRGDDPDRHHRRAFDAIVATLPEGSVAYDPGVNAKGERIV